MASKQAVVLSAALATAAAVVIAPRAAAALRRLLLGPCASQDFSLSCCCGRLRAAVRAPAPLHLVCHCDDCQQFATWVAARRPAQFGPLRTADAAGGVRCVQVFKSDYVSLVGGELLEWSRIDPRLLPEERPFTLLRAHATCCGTPLFNTWRELPTCSFFGAAAVGGDALPPPAWRINTKWALAPADSLPPPRGSASFDPFFLLRFISRNALNYRRRNPAPFTLPPEDACTVRGAAPQ